MRIYARKLFPHDISHEISVTTSIVSDFFGGNTQLPFVGKSSGAQGTVQINSATDPRFGGDCKAILAQEGDADVDDLIIIRELKNLYEMELIKKTDPRYGQIINLLGDERHTVITVDGSMDAALTEDELANKLKELYDQYQAYPGMLLFGLRYGDYISENGFKYATLCAKAGISKSYAREIYKGRKLVPFVAERNEIGALTEIPDDSEEEPMYEVKYEDFIEGGKNVIYYGTPGCGKSFYVENDLLGNVDEKFKYRTTFYLDYTHTDFVGQLMPIVKREKDLDGNEKEYVSYKFIPGPFTIALEKAYTNPKENVYLIIEEINRGNAAGILGDLFQLLDREKPGNKKNRPVGQSEYDIDKVDVTNYLRDEKGILLPNDKLFLPSNLTLIGTMNTSDQNVSTLDTAFKRRWQMEKLNNVFKDDHPYKKYYIPGTSVSWELFVNKINEKIVGDDQIGVNAEDKQIGPFFIERASLDVNANEKNTERQRAFAYKMLEYLWSNVSKYGRPSWFKGDPKTLDKLVENFEKDGVGIFEGDIFKDESDGLQMPSDNGQKE